MEKKSAKKIEKLIKLIEKLKTENEQLKEIINEKNLLIESIRNENNTKTITAATVTNTTTEAFNNTNANIVKMRNPSVVLVDGGGGGATTSAVTTSTASTTANATTTNDLINDFG